MDPTSKLKLSTTVVTKKIWRFCPLCPHFSLRDLTSQLSHRFPGLQLHTAIMYFLSPRLCAYFCELLLWAQVMLFPIPFTLLSMDEQNHMLDTPSITSCSIYYSGTKGCADGLIRLVEGSTATEETVQYCNNGVWGWVCGDSWNADTARVACRQLGLPTSSRL